MRNWFKYTLEDKKDKKYSTVLDFTSHQIKKDYSDLDKFFEFTNFNKAASFLFEWSFDFSPKSQLILISIVLKDYITL